MIALPVCRDEFYLLALINDPHDCDAEEIGRVMERVFTVHAEYASPLHYCINIKVTHLPLTEKQEQTALTRLDDVWNMFLRPWIHDFFQRTKCRIICEGRSGGYLTIDGLGEILEGNEPDCDIEDKVKALIKLKREWEQYLCEIKRWLNTVHPRSTTRPKYD